jgi:glycosyltransferase involved in cell wall biosynthesis
MASETPPPPLAVVVKGWPRLSETFIAQEMKALEDRGLAFEIWSLRRPTDRKTHPLHKQVRARVRYLPEYLMNEPARVLRGLAIASKLPGFKAAWRAWLDDVTRDFSFNRIRRFGQACVLAAEAPAEMRFVYAHFLHTPGSVARYAAMMRRVGWGVSAHARDIWTIPKWEKTEKLASARFAVTCTAAGAEHLNSLAPRPDAVRLLYHGLDLSRFPPAPAARRRKDGTDMQDPVILVSVGRLIEKKGYQDLLKALGELPRAMRWRLVHIGDGPMAAPLRQQAAAAGIAHRIEWRGPADQTEVIAALREGDVFVLAPRIAADGDRDGLPNVLLEAASQKLPIVSTELSGIPEFVEHMKTGVLVRPNAPRMLAEALMNVARDPDLRETLAEAAHKRLTERFGAAQGAEALAARLRAELALGR